MKRLISILFCFCLISVLPGCTPYKELKDLAVVEGVGFDKMPTGELKMTFQIFNAKANGGGGGNGEKGSKQASNLVVQGIGKNIYDAIRNTTLQIGQKLYFSNANTYVLSENLCRTDFDKVVDFLERAPEVRPKVRLIVAKGGEANKILTAKKEDQLIPIDDVNKILENYTTTSKINDITVHDICQKESTGYTDIALPAIKASIDDSGSDVLSMDGTAVFQKNKLIGYFNNIQTRGLLLASGKANGGIFAVQPSVGGTVSLEITNNQSKTTVKSVKGKPMISIVTSVSSNIAEIETPKNVAANQKFYNELTILQNAEIKAEIEAAINLALREYDSDILGFGMKIYHTKPDLWRKASTNWPQNLKTLPVEVTVNSKVEFSGLLTNKVTQGDKG